MSEPALGDARLAHQYEADLDRPWLSLREQARGTRCALKPAAMLPDNGSKTWDAACRTAPIVLCAVLTASAAAAFYVAYASI